MLTLIRTFSDVAVEVVLLARASASATFELLTNFEKLGNESTSVHFHGLFQNGTNDMDGPVGVTQCDIPPGSSMTYNFTVSIGIRI